MTRTFAKKITAYLLAACLVAQPAFGAVTDIASVPLGSTAGATFLPNLLFTLDESGSMAWRFLPDYVDPNTSGMTNNPCMSDSTGSTNCNAGDPPYAAGGQFAMNGVAYDPNFTYLPGLTSAGANVTTVTPPTVTNDAYLGGGTTNLSTSIQDERYCNSKPSNATSGWAAVCKRNGQDDVSGNLVSGTDDQGNTMSAGQFPYHTNAANASAGAIFGLPEMMQIGSFTRSSSTVTVGTISPPGLTTSDKVYVTTGNSNLNVTCVAVSAVTGPNAPPASPYTFSYATSSSGTIAATSGSYRKCATGTFARSGTTVTVTTSAAHGLSSNDGIATFVASGNAMNIASAVVTVTSTTQFTYTASTSGTITSTAGFWVRNDLYNVVNDTTGPAVSYWIKPIEWCKDVALTDCAQYIPPATVPADHPFPAYVRFCRSQAEALAPGAVTFVPSTPAVARCQLKYVNTTVSGTPVQYIYPRYGWFNRDTIKSGLTFLNRPNRSDCTGAPTCTYAQEIQNYANWWAYYQTRMQMMKTSAGRAFLPFISAPTASPPKADRLRVGFITINPNVPNGSSSAQTNIQSSKYLRIDTFNTTNAANWYNKFYPIIPGNSTPLRLALSRAGWIYAGKLNTGLTTGIPTSDDPLQASCQKNFTFLTTDGFWNQGQGEDISGTAIGNGTGSTGTNTNSAIVNQDGMDGDSAYNAKDASGTHPNPYAGLTPPDFFSSRSTATYDGTAAGSKPVTAGSNQGTAGTLADISMYYYRTDLRGGFDLNNNVTGPATSPNTTPTAGGDVSTNNVTAVPGGYDFAVHQHMSTFTIGLADGLLRYQSNYDATPTPAGDFANIKGAAVGQCFWSGAGNACNWPAPIQNGQEALDDLWHAAVNGRGKFFSALNPTALANGLNGALNALQVTTASASAAATSSPQVSASNTLAFSTTYETSLWAGQVYAQLIDPQTGSVITTGANNGKVWEADTLMLSKIGPTSDTRNILMFDTTNANGTRLKQFQFANMSATEQGYFLNKCVPASNMAQCTTLTPTQLLTANDGVDLVNFLRGQTGNEGTVFRDRSEQDPNNPSLTDQTVLGDIINAQPVDVLAPFFHYENESTHPEPPGQTYPTFRTNNANRVGPLLIASNDGYLHAFNPNTGVENWAYAPRFLLPNLYQLSDFGYPGAHRYYVDGTPETTDVFDATAAIWKTIVVGGTNAGGRGYYALDITDPLNPKGLWEFCSDSTLCPTDASGNIHSDSDLGFSYGNPIIGRRVSDGRWVIVVTSGLNNVSPGTGVGFFYVLDAITGQILHKVSTGVGDSTTPKPSGLMKQGAYFPDGIDDPTFTHVYGGDQLGNVWRLDMSQTMSAFPTVTTGSPSVKLLATLKDSAGRIQPITARPAGTHVGTQRIYYVGTGRYLGNSDLSDPGAASGIAWQQSIYGIRDQLDNPTFTPQANFRNGNVVVQTLTDTAGGRTITKFPVDWTTQDGFYIDLNPNNTSPGERIFLDVRLILGTLIFTSNVPSAGGACVPGGNSFQYGLDYLTGGYVGNNSAVLAGINIGAFLVGAAIEQTADNQIKALNKTITGQNVTQPVPMGTGFQGQRFGYRER